MNIRIAIAIVAIAFALSQTTHAQAPSAPNMTPMNAAPQTSLPLNQVVTGPVFAVAPENTPMPDLDDDTVSNMTRPAASPTPQNSSPIYESVAPSFAVPIENTPEPTTPGENP